MGCLAMDDFDKYIEEKRRKEKEERLAFLKKCANKVKDNDSLIYRLLALGLSQRFKIKLRWDGEPQYVVHPILKYYAENIDIDWDEWLESDDAPMIKQIGEVKRILPELVEITDDESEIVDLANKLYGLELYTDEDCCNSAEYFYAYSFDFNTFKPINVKEIKELKIEKEVLSKYGYDTTGIDEKLAGFGLTEEQLGEL
jgi:hypothetical protein